MEDDDEGSDYREDDLGRKRRRSRRRPATWNHQPQPATREGHARTHAHAADETHHTQERSGCTALTDERSLLLPDRQPRSSKYFRSAPVRLLGMAAEKEMESANRVTIYR